MKALGVLILLAVWLVGCARHVVVEPEEVPALNSTWTVTSEPVKTVPERAPAKDKSKDHKADTN
jgi:hypothetical protein